MASEPRTTLTPEQLHALFDILNHKETYHEAESFKYGHAISEYGYPFTSARAPERDDPPAYTSKSSSPLLQLLLTKCILTVPGMSDLPPDFWPCNFQGVMSKLADANLSESYDKGTLGTRKTLATGASVIHEAVTRGLLGGVAPGKERINLKEATYDTTQAPELARAWNECVQELIHGSLADELFDHCAKTADVEAHSPAVAAAADYVILHLASLLHHIFVLSSEGQYLLKLLESVYKLVPFSMVRQTLRIGNAATMMHGMLRIFLAKMSVGAMTNWMGLTSGADDGMNLLQRIISLVLSWDASDFRKQASQIESAKEHPTKEHLAALKDYLSMPREAHQAMREISIKEGKSIVAVIFETTDPGLMASLSDSQHTQCLDWFSAQLSARDRDEITKVMCKSQPDFLTAAVRGVVGAYEPFIRSIHEAMDLREHITAMEKFLADFIETSRPKTAKGGWKFQKNGKTNNQDTRAPSVEDYVALIRRNKALLYNYCHQFAKNCVDVREQFRSWVHLAITEFRQQNDLGKTDGADVISGRLQDMYASLPVQDQATVSASLDAHAAYLGKLDALSSQRMQRVLDQLEKDQSGANQSEKGGLRGSGSGSDSGSGSGSGSGNSSSKSSSKSSSPRASSGGPSMSGPGVYLLRWDALLDETLVTPATPHGPVRNGKEVKGQKTEGKTGVDGAKGGWDAAAIAREEDRVVPAAPDMGPVVELLGGKFRDMVNETIGDVVPSVNEKVAYLINERNSEGLARGVQGVALAG